jgi:hypothetical protein
MRSGTSGPPPEEASVRRVSLVLPSIAGDDASPKPVSPKVIQTAPSPSIIFWATRWILPLPTQVVEGDVLGCFLVGAAVYQQWKRGAGSTSARYPPLPPKQGSPI